MRVPLSWLRELVPIELPVDELLEVMGRNGLEIEEVRTPGAGVSGVVVARVLDVRAHPDADKLVVVRVDDGHGERTVCAGARNLGPGDLVPLAQPGATLPDGRGGTVTITQREMRGVVSDGMLCSPRELQVADDHSGIMILDAGPSAPVAEPGTGLEHVLPLGEPILDIAVPADRGDLHSVLGVARDLAAILDVELSPPPDPAASPVVQGEYGDVPVRVEAPDGCSRYVGWVVRGVTAGPSPWWLRRRLEACGVRSVSNLVDITNYVMLELGQPLHAFDLARLHGPLIEVRWAREGERLVTLDGRERELESDDLVIADEDRAIALAGVMGGEDTEIDPSTSDLLVEAATFDAAAVRRTSRRLGLVSEASTRFERGVDPEIPWRAAARAVELLAGLAGGTDGGVRVGGHDVPAPPSIVFDPRWAAGFLGIPGLDPERQAAYLRRIGADVQDADGSLTVVPPSWRADLSRPADLAEEVARLHGYERVPTTMPPISLRGGLSVRQLAERDVRAAALAAGFHEAQTTPFVAGDALVLVAPDDTGRVTISNPLQKDAATMRPSLAEGLLGAARHNVGQGRDAVALFEVGRIFRPADGPLAERLGSSSAWLTRDGRPLPAQPVTLGLVALGPREGPGWQDRSTSHDVFDVLAVLDDVVSRLAPDPADAQQHLRRVPVERPKLHPGRTAELSWDDRVVGVVGQLHPVEAERRDLPASTVVGELLLDPLWEHLDGDRLEPRQAAIVRRHPALTLDVAVVADVDIPFARLEEAVRTGAGDLLDRLFWFDEYRGEQVGGGRRSLAFHLRLQDPERQLTDEDAERVVDRIETVLGSVGATLRR